MLVLNSWLKDVEMHVKECKLTNLEAVHLIKDYKTDNARDVEEFYLDTNSTWKYKELIGHHSTSLESGETLSSLAGDFYNHVQSLKETEDQFANEFQI